MKLPEIMKSWTIAVHVSSWIVGGIAFGLMAATELDGLIWVCFISGVIAFLSSVAALPVALIGLFQRREASLFVRLQYAGAAIMAATVLIGGVTLNLMNAGRH